VTRRDAVGDVDLHVTAALLPSGLVLLEMGTGGPHWVMSADDARAVGWSLIDAANGHQLPGGVPVTDCHTTVAWGGG
jgi:hypothetical protein